MIILPSRRRPALCARFFQAYAATGAVEPGVLILERGDEAAYADVQRPPRWETWVVEPSGACKKFNDAATVYAPREDRYFICADDLVPETPEWDARLRAAAGACGVAFADDGIQRGAFPTHPCAGGDFVRALGYLFNPIVAHFYSDNMIGDIARALGVLTYLPEVRVTHRHFTNGGAWDETYASRGSSAADEAIYREWLRTVSGRDLDRVREALCA